MQVTRAIAENWIRTGGQIKSEPPSDEEEQLDRAQLDEGRTMRSPDVRYQFIQKLQALRQSHGVMTRVGQQPGDEIPAAAIGGSSPEASDKRALKETLDSIDSIIVGFQMEVNAMQVRAEADPRFITQLANLSEDFRTARQEREKYWQELTASTSVGPYTASLDPRRPSWLDAKVIKNEFARGYERLRAVAGLGKPPPTAQSQHMLCQEPESCPKRSHGVLGCCIQSLVL